MNAVRAAAVAALGGLIFGYDVSLVNSTVDAMQVAFGVGDAMLGFAASASLLGAAAGAMIAGRSADRIGRVAAMQRAAALFLVGVAGAFLATTVWPFIIFRVVGGVGIGVASVVTPAYIAEISPPAMRGRLGSLKQLAVVFGILFALVVDWLLAGCAGGSSGQLWWGLPAWRWMFLGEAVPALLYGILACTIPESPRYLVAAHRIPEARRVIAALSGAREVDATVDRIRQTLRRPSAPSWRDLRRPTGGLYPIVWVGLGLAVFQQLVGINVIFFYSKVLWQAVGFAETSSFGISVGTAVINVAVTVVAIGLIDRVGRRRLLLVGSVGMTVTSATLAVVFATAPVRNGAPHLTGLAGPLALTAANVFVIAFGVSWGPILWVQLGEMFPNRIRAAALGLAMAAQWLANWAVVMTFPMVRDLLGFAYGFYTVSTLASVVFVWRWVRETNGVPLEDMAAELRPPTHETIGPREDLRGPVRRAR